MAMPQSNNQLNTFYCQYCGVVDDHYDENVATNHSVTPKHICNRILFEYKHKKKEFSSNRHGIFIFGSAESKAPDEASVQKVERTAHHKIWIYVKPKQKVKFSFDVSSDIKKEDLLIVGIQLAHPQPHFVMNDHPYIFGEEPLILERKSSIKDEISVTFQETDIGQYEMPIMFTFRRTSDMKDIIVIREMVVMVEETPTEHLSAKSPYTDKDMTRAEHFIRSVGDMRDTKFKIPKLLKILLALGLEEESLHRLPEDMPDKDKEQLRMLLISTKSIFLEGITKPNYMNYFHHLLWWEEIVAKINIRRYNMTGVTILKTDRLYRLEVPGLAEKRPSLMRGDRVFLQPHANKKDIFECVIKDIKENCVYLSDMDESFNGYYSSEALFDVRFIMSRVPMERCHEAVYHLFSSKQDCRVFPQPVKRRIAVKPIKKFYNKFIKQNEEQKSAVEHIVSGTSGTAPYIVFGPPGTGKTMTIVEAIIQIVVRNPKNRVMVCTDSNMAADHVALALLKYNNVLNINNFILRANSQTREWSVMPSELAPVSNGTSFETFCSISNAFVGMHRIVVTTLSHAAKYASDRSQRAYKLQMSHLFIDEAAQASEPATLVPITGLLSPNGRLVLAGDPKQLGPVCMSKEASVRGLGKSLLERLCTTHMNLYNRNPDYITMLVKNFRSHADILQLPNELFYKNELQALAPLDKLSQTNILDLPGRGGERAVVFHAVHSREQRMGKAPSYFNEKELDMLKRYIKSLINNHKVLPEDIGIIAPYIRQVYKMKAWLMDEKYDKIEVGTVEAFQGKEKRAMLVSTVRANCRLLEYDAKYGLGFLVDDKRFNVALTRAKAKLIIIGSPACLTRDKKWRMYMGKCEELETYFGKENQQIERTAQLLVEVSRTRFDRCHLTEALKERGQEPKEQQKSNKNKGRLHQKA